MILHLSLPSLLKTPTKHMALSTETHGMCFHFALFPTQDTSHCTVWASDAPLTFCRAAEAEDHWEGCC